MPDLKVNIVQLDIAWKSPEKNRNRIEKLLKEAPISDLIALPEMFTTGFTMDVKEVAETMDGDSIEWMKNLAGKSRSVITGSLIIKDRGSYYNRLIWMRPDGSMDYYDKKHLFRMAGEEEHFSEGSKKIYPVLKGWRICPLICYDLRFPVWSRNQNDYDMLLFVANWPQVRNEAWKTLSKARAIENLTPVISVNRVGRDGKGIDYSGDSMVIDSKGNIQAELAQKQEGVIFTTIKASEAQDYREKFPAYLDADEFTL